MQIAGQIDKEQADEITMIAKVTVVAIRMKELAKEV